MVLAITVEPAHRVVQAAHQRQQVALDPPEWRKPWLEEPGGRPARGAFMAGFSTPKQVELGSAASGQGSDAVGQPEQRGDRADVVPRAAEGAGLEKPRSRLVDLGRAGRPSSR